MLSSRAGSVDEGIRARKRAAIAAVSWACVPFARRRYQELVAKLKRRIV